MWKKQMVIFLLVVMMVISNIVPIQIKAAEYLTVVEFCNKYGITSSVRSDYNVIQNPLKYFVFYKINGIYGILSMSTLRSDSCVIFSSSSNFTLANGSNDGFVNYANISGSLEFGNHGVSPRVYYSHYDATYKDTVTILYANFDIKSWDFTTNNSYNVNFVFDLYTPITPKPTPTNTPKPTPTNTPKPTATNTPKPTATNTPKPTATNTPTPTPRITSRPTATPRLTATPRPTATIRPTYTPTNSDIQSDVNSIVDVVKVVISLFSTFPLNVILIGWILIVGIGLYKLLKDSVK